MDELKLQFPNTRIAQQLTFLAEADKLKSVLRQTLIIDKNRQENSAEHSWHLILAAMVLSQYAAVPVNLTHVVKLLAVHDLVEIDAGDTFAYDAQANASKAERELAAAERIFGLLPPDQGSMLQELWQEFEANISPEAQFANAVDRVQPFLQNSLTGGGTWKMHRVQKEQVLKRMQPVKHMLPDLWPWIENTLDSFYAKRALS